MKEDPPEITTLLEPGATGDFTSTAARLIYGRTPPNPSPPTAAQETQGLRARRLYLRTIFTPSHILPFFLTNVFY